MKKYQIVFILFCVSLYAQNTALNHSKYWFYRYRLRNEFMNLGEDACGKASGKMIPSGSRYKKDAVDKNGKILPHRGFGDGTSHLGIYMAVLASEFEILKKSTKTQAYQLDSLRKELYWAMKAYERLDRNAEGGDDLQPNGMVLGDCRDNDNLNGFFIREDDGPFTCNEMRRNYFEKKNGERLSVTNEAPTLGSLNVQFDGLKENHRFKNNRSLEEFSCDYNVIPPDHCDTIANTWDKIKCYTQRQFVDRSECQAEHIWNSADQLSNLMVGFAYVVKLMGRENWKGYVFKDNAKEYCRRIGNYFDGKHARWKIMVPGHDKIAVYGGKFEFGQFAYGISRSLDAIVNERWSTDMFDTYDYTSRMADFSPSIWHTLNYPTGKIVYNNNFNGRDFNNALISQNAAVGNSWAEGLVPVEKTLVSLGIPYPCGTIKNCEMGCLIPSRFGCLFPNVFSCVEYCREEINLKCYSYTITPNILAAIHDGHSNVLTKITSTLALAGFNIANTQIQAMQDFGICMSYVVPLPKISINTTSYALTKYGALTNTELFGMEHSLLHNERTSTDMDKIREYLNTAPCSGPHYMPYYDPHNYPDITNEQQSSSVGIRGWRTDNRFEKSNINTTEAKLEPVGYPGLDYMLLHNTYYLLANRYGPDGFLGDFVNEHRRYITRLAYPLSLSPEGIASKTVENGYESLEINDVNVFSVGNIEFRSGLGVKISGNTKFAAGSTVKVGTKYEYPCNINTGQYNDLSYPANLQRTAATSATTASTATDASDTTQYYADIAQQFSATLDQNKDVWVQALQKAKAASAYQSIEAFVAKYPVASSSANMRLAQTTEAISIVPNPTLGPTTVKVRTGQYGEATLQVYDALGYLKANFSASLSTENYDWAIDLTHLSSGLYNLVYVHNNTYISQQFHKQ